MSFSRNLLYPIFSRTTTTTIVFCADGGGFHSFISWKSELLSEMRENDYLDLMEKEIDCKHCQLMF